MNFTARTGLAIAAVVGPLLLVGCSSGSSTAEPAASGTVSTVGGPQADSGDCAATQVYGDASQFGREWLLAYKQNPSTPVSLLRCHYVHNPNGDGDPSAPDAPLEALTGDLVPPPVIIPGGAEVQKIILALPYSTDLGHRCIGPGVGEFDEFRVLDHTGTAVAKFQTSGSDACGVLRVIPSA